METIRHADTCGSGTAKCEWVRQRTQIELHRIGTRRYAVGDLGSASDTEVLLQLLERIDNIHAVVQEIYPPRHHAMRARRYRSGLPDRPFARQHP